MINVKVGIASNGNMGLIERPKSTGLPVRVFEVLNNDVIVFRYYDEWYSDGKQARSYPCGAKPSQLMVG
tara:strand:- start:711 stop:917 length:207 start_codon:yes stop_codon:yes gene_type:complete